MKTEIIAIHPTFPETEKINKCAKVIRQGGLVIFPTETVYGIAADYNNKKAIARLRQVKHRPDDKPFSVLVPHKELIEHLAGPIECSVYKLIDMYWPGPLTIVVPSKEEGKTVGLRMPDNIIALNLAKAAGCPIAAPSANIADKKPPVTCQEALQDLEGRVEIAIDAGQTLIGKESTVIDAATNPVKVLREGPLTQEDIDRVTQQKVVLLVCTGNSCRSVMAEYLLKKFLGPRKNIKVLSAGTSVYVSMGASAETMAVLQKEGIDASMHRSQPLNKIMLKKADLILGMTKQHRDRILQLAPEVEKRVYLLREFANVSKSFEGDLDIPDPIGKPYPVYEECIWIIKEAIHKIAELV